MDDPFEEGDNHRFDPRGRSFKAIRDGKGWRSGQQLVVEETQDGVLLRPASPFAPTKPEEVFGSLSHHGKRLSDRDIEKALSAAAKRRYVRD